MKKLIFLAAILIPSTALADRLGSLKSNADVLLSTQAAAGGFEIYPATSTPNFPFALDASTITLRVDDNTGGPGITYYNDSLPTGLGYFPLATIYSGGSLTAKARFRAWAVGNNGRGFIWGDSADSEGMKFDTTNSRLHVLSSSGTANLNINGSALIGSGAIGKTPDPDGLRVSGTSVFQSSISVQGKSVCLDDGTNCPSSGGGSSIYPATSTVILNRGTRVNVDSFSNNITLTSTHTVVLASATATASRTITLPAATNTGLTLTISKVDGSTYPVIVQRGGTDTIESTTTIRLNAQFQKVTLVADGVSSWIAPNGLPADLMYSGPEQKWGTTTAATITSSQAVITAFILNDYIAARGVILQIGASSGFLDVGVYDARSRARLASSGKVASPGTGLQIVNFSSPVHLKPGSYYLAASPDNATFSVTRCGSQSTFGGMIANTSHPLPATLSDPPGSQTGTGWCMSLAAWDGMTR